jgi:NlpC/P60 family putative phage cell wall peptidase
MRGEIDGEAVVDAARRWLGTPYRHQGSLVGVGADCLGLLRGVWRDLKGDEPEPVAPYTPDWAEVSAFDPLLGAAQRHFVQTNGELKAGRIVLFRWGPRSIAKHAGILTGSSGMIHAYSGSGVVISPLVPAWRRRIAGVFAFPGDN